MLKNPQYLDQESIMSFQIHAKVSVTISAMYVILAMCNKYIIRMFFSKIWTKCGTIQADIDTDKII